MYVDSFILKELHIFVINSTCEKLIILGDMYNMLMIHRWTLDISFRLMYLRVLLRQNLIFTSIFLQELSPCTSKLL